MYVDRQTYKQNNKIYTRTLLRESYRENGKVKHRTAGNLSHCSEEEVEAIRIALKHKDEIVYLEKLVKGGAAAGNIIGAVCVLYRIADRLGIIKSLGHSKEGLLVLWMIIARLIEGGSRLSAVRLAKIHGVYEILGVDAFNEDKLYGAMDRLYEERNKVEERFYRKWEQTHSGNGTNHIFLYDVSSSYVEGEKNELAQWGYNRDKKKGKKQIVYGLLTDERGEPLALEAFNGNTKDNKTVSAQIERIKERFGCKYVTFVGDKGMLKSEQTDDLDRAGYHYITSITKAQIETLLKKDIIQLELFDSEICEVKDMELGVRYIFRRNPYRAAEIRAKKEQKLRYIVKKTEEANKYLEEHKRAGVSTGLTNLNEKISKLNIGKFANITQVEESRRIELKIDERAIEEGGKLDGCYVIKTDLPEEAAEKEIIHDRYKALKEVEWAFRTEKTYLNIRPVYVRKKGRTAAHLIIQMFAYKIAKYLREAWGDLDLTVSEGIKHLSRIVGNIVVIGDKKVEYVPRPDKTCRELLNRVDVVIPNILPYRETFIDTRKKLLSRRKR